MDIKKIFAQKTARLRGFLMYESLDLKSQKRRKKQRFGFSAESETSHNEKPDLWETPMACFSIFSF
ncbi:hypothetical protein [Acutalibacter sp. 1XD8-36]|uniref:hypothetical protein n=1 Tax=Acutalibacter sp. 1XD8-36 TaxID=2320852 RepID=UPI0026353AF1|nr:hypothetical protein [Acutalibacter sp. 1XD8-36]